MRMEGAASRAFRAALAARLGQEGDAEGLDEAHGRQRAGQGQHRARQRKDQPPQAFARAEALQQGLIREPLADKAVERRQGGDGDSANAESKSAVSGIRLASPPISSMLRVWVECATAPAPRNNNPLNAA